MINKIHRKNNNNGITMVIAIMSMTLLLSLSVSISNIVLRQIRITAVNNDSKVVFFTADSASECARYFDTTIINSGGAEYNQDFANSIFGQAIDLPDGKDLFKSIVTCGNNVAGIRTDYSTDQLTVKTTFDIDYGETCAKVIVEKTDNDTSIVTKGYNTGFIDGSGCDLSNIDSRRVVERGLTITY